MKINPIELNGPWDEGWALDQHIIKSVALGENAYGHMQFDNEYSYIGELLYNFKYKDKYDNLPLLVDNAINFLDDWGIMESVDIIMPVPFSKIRSYQPAFEIAHSITENYNVSYVDSVLKKNTAIQSKEMNIYNKNLVGSIIATQKAKGEHNILLVDDLFSTGATINECVRVLREDKKVKKIYVLVMTKTKRG